MRKSSHNFRKALASFLAFVMVMLSTSLFTTISVFAAEGDITYLAPVYDTDGNVTFDNDGNVVMTEQTLTDGTYNVVTENATVMGMTDTAAVEDAKGEYWYVVNASITVSTRIVVSGTVHLILCDGFELTDRYGIQVSEGNEFTVYGQSLGTGTLSSPTTSSRDGAGIGGDTTSPNAGEITINGGTVTATGMSTSGAGIGGGNGGNGGEITINGGTVQATGGTYYGAGIGGSGGGSGGNITINGGQVVANAGGNAAAIGGSLSGSSGNITINGGVVTANPNSGENSCGIGAGSTGKLDSVTINGGIITAIGSAAAAIGTAGYKGTEKGDIVINGGKVTATITKGTAPAIGNNDTGTVDVTINGGYVEATGSKTAAGIGGGTNANSGQITISGGTVIARAGTCTTGSSFSAAGIGGGGSTRATETGGIGYVTITDGYVEAYGNGNSAYANMGGAGIGGGRMNYGVILISGGCIIAEGGPDADGIGGGAGRNINTQFAQVQFTGGFGGSSGDSSSGSSGTTTPDIGSEPDDSQIQSSGAIIFATSIPDMSEEAIEDYTGIICIKYGSTLAYSPSEYVFTENFTVPADYTLEIDSGESLTISNGATLTVNGSIVNNGTLTLNKGTTVTGDGALISTKAGNSFKGWYTDEGLTLPFYFDTPIEQDTTLYPKFEEGAAVVNVDIQGVTSVTSAVFTDTFGKTTYRGTPMAYATDDFGKRFVELEYDVEYFLLTLNENNEIIARTPVSQSERWFPGTYETVITVVDNNDDGFDYQGQLSWQTVITKNPIQISPFNQIYGQDESIADNLFSVSTTAYGSIHQNSITTATVYEQDGILYLCDAKIVTSDGLDITKYYDITYNTGTATQATVEDIQASAQFNVTVNSIYVPYEKLIRKEAVSICVRVNNNAPKYLGSDFEISIITDGLKGIDVDGNSLVVTPEFTQNTSDSATPFKKSVSISVTYTNGEFFQTETKAVTISWEEPTATRIAIYKDGNEIISDSLDITEGATATYTAKVLDQYGYEMADQDVTWADSTVDGVTMQDGVLTAESSTESKNGVFTVTAGVLSVDLPIEFVGESEQEHTCDHSGNTNTDDGDCTTDVTCSACGAVIAEGNTTHAYDDGVCTVCGTLNATLVGSDLTLDGNIGLNFYFELDEAIVSSGTALVRFTLENGKVIEIPVSEGVLDITTVAGKTLYVFTCELNAKQMADIVIAQVIMGEKASAQYPHSIVGYANTIIANAENKYTDKEIALVKAMLNYGANAQLNFGYNTEHLANAGLTEAEKSLSNVTKETFESYKVTAKTVEGIGTFAGSDLVLESETTLNVYFKPADGVKIEDLTFTVGDKTVTPVKSGEYYVISITNITSSELDTEYEISVNDGTASGTFQCSVFAYCYSVLSDTTDTYTDELKDTLKALYLYNEAANTYFNSEE